MASPLTQRALQRIADTGFTKAKKLADLAIKTNTDSAGNPTARGYQAAVELLQPYINSGKEKEAIDAQRLVAGYNNNLDKLSNKERNQNETVAAFKLQELDSYFTSFDGDVSSFRNPGDLIDTTSSALDNIVLGVINAIDEKEATNESTDALYAYLNDVQKRADSMRDLKNKYQSGELAEGQSLDGFGYYVDTNPLDGSIRGAALLPVGLAPEGIASGYRRLNATTKIGDALLPVYAPAQKDSYGEYVARVGNATWAGTGDGALNSEKADKSANYLFKEGQFSVADRNNFAVRKNTLSNGSFGKGFIGKDEQGNPVEKILYRGVDGKLYNVDQATLDNFKKDPVLAAKLDGYVAQFSPTEIKELAKEAQVLPDDRISRESRIAGFQQSAATAQAEADRLNNLGFFGKLKEGFMENVGKVSKWFGGGQAAEEKQSFFQNKTSTPATILNVPNKPEEAPTGGTPENLIETGKGFFRAKIGQ